ncbi:hypothetical protein BC936DRAFT_141418 [Jimgerdemannia flammicorona]|uniref:Uncharacterized protein n=2 Tax=Jimgerdemannia flammicorona TaxID=994334 RepID=A0A433Q771_9FUNG|nr:hypothetical protein BC936DRAFT_141418 [Jimgerdemannia flammicorona]RUS25599.1 hypothetical protein BC938DRAFT_471914 [Jimgerdemannia flammicorona]
MGRHTGSLSEKCRLKLKHVTGKWYKPHYRSHVRRFPPSLSSSPYSTKPKQHDDCALRSGWQNPYLVLEPKHVEDPLRVELQGELKLEFRTEALTYLELHKELPKICDQGQFPPTVPTITDSKRDGAIWDSFKIAEYLEEAYPEHSIFGKAKSLHLFFQEYVSTFVTPAARNLLMVDQVREILDEPSAKYYRESREARLGKTLEELCGQPGNERRALKTALVPVHATIKKSGAFVSGSTVGYSDFILGGAFVWMQVVNVGELDILLDSFGDNVFRDWFARLDPYK